MILIFLTYKSNRIKYIFDFIFNDVLSAKYSITYNRSDYDTYNGPKFVYSHEPINDNHWIWAHEIMFETDIRQQNIQVSSDENFEKIFFKSPFNHSWLPFDIFAASFYLISRYEEYLPSQLDEHDRFSYKQSIAYKNNFLNRPLVNEWIETFKQYIQRDFNYHLGYSNGFKLIPTFDIDNIYAFKGKSFLRQIFGFINAILHKRTDMAVLRLKYWLKQIDDPYDSFDYIIESCNLLNIKPIFFVLVGKTSMYDTNLDSSNECFIKKVEQLSMKAQIALHASYSSTNKQTIEIEKSILENLINNKITENRFHFLRLKIPESYQQLLEAGIYNDFSMGYSNTDGFRASVGTPFNFYDLTKEQTTELKIFPFVFMDRYLVNHKIEQSTIGNYLNYYKKYKVPFVLLWHNENLMNNQYGQIYRNYFEYILKYFENGIYYNNDKR